MTFSIVARMGQAYGVAVASKFVAVGAVVPRAQIGVGAAATQAMAKVSFRDDALDLLARGSSAADATRSLIEADIDSEQRQLAVVSATDEATFTGSACMDWAGGTTGSDQSGGYAIQGNILVGEQVIQDVERAWLDSPHLAIAPRLVHALLAGDRAGGDRRGRQSAALYAVQPGAGYDACGVIADLRVDDHSAAPTELARLLDVHELYFGTPTEVLPLQGRVGEEVGRHLAALGRTQPDVHAALADWAGEANFEMRLSAEGIDVRLLQALREQAVAAGEPRPPG